jgi:hypothetical protein
MKLILLLIFCFSINTSFALAPRPLSCSFRGTDVILVNGINWRISEVKDIIKYNLKPYLPSNLVDSSKKGIEIFDSYNSQRGLLEDLLESSAQKISASFKVSKDQAFAITYLSLFKSPLNPLFVKTILAIGKSDYSTILASIQNSFDITSYAEKMRTEFRTMISDTELLKKYIITSVEANRKLILLGESQGNFFINDAVTELMDTSNLQSFKPFIGNVQVATPQFTVLEKNRVVLNDEDIIRLVFFDRPSPTFRNFQDPTAKRDFRVWLDRYLDHFFDGTYLNAYNSGGSMPELKEYTLQAIVDVASLLESNCPTANFIYSVEDLTATFSSDEMLNKNLKGVIYEWDFGDGTNERTTSTTISHTYSQNGNYNVTLITTDEEGTDFGEIATKTKQIQLSQEPTTVLMTLCPFGNIGTTMTVNISGIGTYNIDSNSGNCYTIPVIENSRADFYVTATPLNGYPIAPWGPTPLLLINGQYNFRVLGGPGGYYINFLAPESMTSSQATFGFTLSKLD